MKKHISAIIVALALFAVAVIIGNSKASGQQQHQAHWAVVFYASDGGNGDLVIYGLSSGGPAPQVHSGDKVGPTLAKLMDAGGVVNHTGDGLVYTVTN